MSYNQRLETATTVAVISCAIGLCSTIAPADDLLGVSFGGVLYDVNTVNGNTSNPRATGVSDIMGITRAQNGTIFALTSHTSGEPNSLVTVNPDTADTDVVGQLGFDVNEGDLDFDPVTGQLFGIQTLLGGGFGRSLFSIDPDTGEGQIIGPMSSDASDFSAMAFDDNGTLYVLDTNILGIDGTRLLTVSTATGQILTDTAVDIDLGFVAGMDFDPVSGKLFVADGGNFGTDTLYTLALGTGQLTAIGPLNQNFGLSGLEFIPCEPRPANDDCEDAALTFLGEPTPFSNVCATTDGPPHARCDFSSDDQVGSDVWFRRTATCTGWMTVTICGTATYDTKIAIYDGCDCPVNDDRLLICNDNAVDCPGNTSEATVSVVKDQCYLIRIGGFQGAQGSSTVDFICDSITCDADVDEDGDVDVDDLFAVLAAWGPCDECIEDVNTDGVVDIDDVFAVLAAWGPCP